MKHSTSLSPPSLLGFSSLPERNEDNTIESANENGEPASGDGSTTVAKALTASIEETTCPVCDKVAQFRCTRCQVQRYCSRDCQRTHWMQGHRELCHSINVRDRIILVEMEHESTQQPALLAPQAGILSRNPPEGIFPLKVQVALSSDHAPMMCYDESRSFHYLVHPRNCKRTKLLERSIREHGEMGGAKAYFNAKLLKDDKKLAIYLDQNLGNLHW